jgi:hypothetical protein
MHGYLIHNINSTRDPFSSGNNQLAISLFARFLLFCSVNTDGIWDTCTALSVSLASIHFHQYIICSSICEWGEPAIILLFRPIIILIHAALLVSFTTIRSVRKPPRLSNFASIYYLLPTMIQSKPQLQCSNLGETLRLILQFQLFQAHKFIPAQIKIQVTNQPTSHIKVCGRIWPAAYPIQTHQSLRHHFVRSTS